MGDPLFRPLGPDPLSLMFAAHFPGVEDLQHAGARALEAEGVAQRALWERIEASAAEGFGQSNGWISKNLVRVATSFLLDHDGLYSTERLEPQTSSTGTLTWQAIVFARGLSDAEQHAEEVRDWIEDLRTSPEAEALRLSEDRTTFVRDRVAEQLAPVIHHDPIRPAPGCFVCDRQTPSALGL
ncbi:MAG: hypothetical protein JOZ73_10815 [Solirubrobacterales bacterium]|nr:hypothetical protein [Solirubrobacterales bacterium]